MKSWNRYASAINLGNEFPCLQMQFRLAMHERRATVSWVVLSECDSCESSDHSFKTFVKYCTLLGIIFQLHSSLSSSNFPLELLFILLRCILLELVTDSSEATVKQLVSSVSRAKIIAEKREMRSFTSKLQPTATPWRKLNIISRFERFVWNENGGKAQEKHIKFITRINIIGMCDFNISRTTPLYGCVLLPSREKRK